MGNIKDLQSKMDAIRVTQTKQAEQNVLYLVANGATFRHQRQRLRKRRFE